MSSNFYFHFQREGKESKWELAAASEREQIIRLVRPAFTTVLDLSAIPDDNDWTKVRYKGNFYADFDSEDDLELACDQFRVFLGKLDDELDFDVTQASFWATGSKGLHVEIPQECFLAKPPPTGTTWLPYVYRLMSESLMVDTLDLSVYTGKKGRMWRTPNVKRENGNYKVPITLEEAMALDEDLYRELIKSPRDAIIPTPPVYNAKFAVLFDRSRDKVVSQMRGKKKRMDKANVILDPWKRAKKTPPTIEMIMAGENIREGAGFQSIAMQIAIYATSVGMPLPELLDRCKGLIANHVSDSRRYNTEAKRKEEISRMYEYMESDSLYDFDTGPLVRLLKEGTPTPDLGVMETEDAGDRKPATESEKVEEGEEEDEEDLTAKGRAKAVRRGFFMNSDGMWRKFGDNTECVSRATFRNVEGYYDVSSREFRGYEFDIYVDGKKKRRVLIATEVFHSAANLRKWFVNNQLSFQGAETEAMALLDIMNEKASHGGKSYVYPREGFFLTPNPEADNVQQVKCYLTKDSFMTSLKESDPKFTLRYKPDQAASAYEIDIHWAPDLDESHVGAIHDLLNINRPGVNADLVGWFVACHYASLYRHLFNQFPLLQIYGLAGSGKSQTVKLLCHLHWYTGSKIAIRSATSVTNYAIEQFASSSTSAPFVIDEYKPKELRKFANRYEKVKEILKASYIAADVRNAGTLNKGSENALSMIRCQATAPIVFMGESIEMETAIVERSVIVAMNPSFLEEDEQRKVRFKRLQRNPEALSALGRYIVDMGFKINLDSMYENVTQIYNEVHDSLPKDGPTTMKERMIFNRAVIIHALKTLQDLLRMKFGNEFDADFERLLSTQRVQSSDQKSVVALHSMSEISKLFNRLSVLSRASDEPYEIVAGRDYLVGDGWIEFKVERCYDKYRRYCAVVHETLMYETIEQFMYSLNTYHPVIDGVCAGSDLRGDDAGERIVRLDLAKLRKEGVQSFRG